jgi:hypothetical protein
MAFYINLDSRTDRREQFEAECLKMDIQVERLAAIVHPKGVALGCSASHLAIIKLAREREYPHVMVFEDDFTFLVTKDEFNTVVNTLPEDYDVVMLGYHVNCEDVYSPAFGRTVDAQTTSGYIVHQRAYDKLIACWEQSMARFEESPHQHWLYICDQSWKPLQKELRWYHAIPRAGKQRAGWSDLAQAYVDYNK